MFDYKERDDWEPMKDVIIKLGREFEASWNPPLIQTLEVGYRIPSYRRYFERLLTEKSGPSKRDKLYSKWKACQHYKCYTEYPPQGPLGFTWTAASGTSLGYYGSEKRIVDPLLGIQSDVVVNSFGEVGVPFKGMPSLTEEQGDGFGFVPVPPTLDVLTDVAIKAMLPKAKSELSLINTLIELKDFKSLPRTLSKIKQVPALLASLVKPGASSGTGTTAKFARILSTFSKNSGKTLRELTQTGADSYLQYEFNLRPLWSDIVGIYTAFTGLEKKLASFLRNEGRLRRKHFTCDFFPTQFYVDDAISDYSLDTGQFEGVETRPNEGGSVSRAHPLGLRAHRTTAVGMATFHAEMEYNYLLSSFQREHAHVLNVLDALGLNLNPAIIWNAIPWSFVVDWVFSVGKYLDGRKVLNMEPQVNIMRYVWSWKYTRKTRTYFENRPVELGNIHPVNQTFLPDTWETAYRRDVGIPVSNPYLYGELSSKEVTLGVALAITRKKRRSSRG